MNEHQHRLWNNMIDLIEGYLKNETQDFYGIVGKLEGALDASEIKDNDLINQWYDFWAPFEIRRAVEGKEVNRTKAVQELAAMKEFLVNHLNSNKSRYLLTFELDPDNEILEIHGNQVGLEKLRNVIDSLLAKNKNDHTHLMSENWGGNELSDDKQCSDNEIINHVKIFKWVENSLNT